MNKKQIDKRTACATNMLYSDSATGFKLVQFNLYQSFVQRLYFAIMDSTGKIIPVWREGYDAIPTEVDYKAVFSSSLSRFSAALYREAVKNIGREENLFMSPFSVATAVSMVHAGAKGKTARQIESALRIPANEINLNKVFSKLLKYLNRNDILQAENRIYVSDQHDLLSDFQSILKKHFGAEAETVDFADDSCCTIINNWVEKSTRGKIKKMISPQMVDERTKMMLVNAIYFKAQWEVPFDVEETRKEPFYLGSKKKKVEVDMMHMEGEMASGYLRELDARILRLHYESLGLCMDIILPNKLDGLAELESKLDGVLETYLPCFVDAKLKISIPKFSIESDMDLKQQLEALGMTGMFHAQGDLSLIDGGQDLFVDGVKQKSFLEVNEVGSEAAVATAVRVLSADEEPPPPPPHPPFVADHPFIFVIREYWEKDIILFIGRLSNPI